MVDFNKVKELVEVVKENFVEFVNNKKVDQKVVVEETVNMIDKFLKGNIDDVGHYIVDGVVYDYKTDEFVRYMTEEEIELLYEMRNLKRKLKYM
jgi:hypothetical protein